MEDREQKTLMKGYVGVKFRAIQRAVKPPLETRAFYGKFRQACERLKAEQMTPANGGNLSVRRGSGFFISASGANLGCLEKDEIVFVTECDPKESRVIYEGYLLPSSESIMHLLIYKDRPEAQAIIHAHDELATRAELLAGEVAESEQEVPYGTIELARYAIDTFRRAERIILLKNHGYVAVGPDLKKTCDLVVATHRRLLCKQRQAL